MPDELPIACSLSATDLSTRLQDMADLGRDALLDSRIDGPHAQLRFAPGAGVRDRLAAIVAGESECCGFLAMHIADEPDALLLTVDAPQHAEPVLAELVDAFAGDGAT
jgi:hypothetical protein